MKILVVDDTEANRKLLCWILEDDGHTVVEAVNGQEGVDLFQSESPDLVLMDVMMPVMDGFDSTKAIREILGDTHIPIIFLTALSDDASLAKCLSVGGDDFLSKPINEQVLQAKINAHARIRDLNEELNKQKVELEALHALTEREHEIAKAVFENAMGASLQDCANTRHYISPATTFNGDILLSAPSPSGGLYVILADFTGHGLPAAIGALPLSQTFYNCTVAGDSVSDIARKLNTALEGFLPDFMFAAAAVLEMNADGTRVTFWAGGLPDIIITDANGSIKESVISSHMPLGVLDDKEFEREVIIRHPEPGDKYYIYTDGITETETPDGEMYGDERMQALFDGTQKDPFTKLLYDIKTFRGALEQNDDITIIELTCSPVELETEHDTKPLAQGKLPWSLNMNLDANALNGSSPISQIIDMIGSSPAISEHKDYLHTIMSELFSNALEHGVLELSSELKETEDGYLDYYQQREDRLAALTDGNITINVEFILGDEYGKLKINFNDSGKGFDVKNLKASDDDNAFGRGASLIDTLCDSVEYNETGTAVTAYYTLRSTD
ncbi:hypothetical protein A9Q81_19475 [Gammaproteobacteria bacterium 42_54_T18]|nr:hypothetical protein A9Q81_19475 [Gammaproteobacteria bacterium 42_54_T18]